MAVRLLGPVELTGPSGNAVLSGVRQRALVGALAFNAGRSVPSARLVDALWGAEPPRTAFKTLHGHVARLRRVLHACGSPDLLVTSGSGYLLAASRDDVDGLRFEDIVAAARADLAENRLARAVERFRDGLALWRGDPVQDGELFGWGEAEVHRLQEVRLTAVEDLCDAELRLGRHGSVVAEAERVLVDHPLRERMVELLMQACYRSGRPAEALGAYRRLRVRLADELGADPSADLQRLHTAILRQDVAVEDAAREDAPRPQMPRPAQLPPRVGHFTGRREQMRALDEALDGASDAPIVVVSGAGGMGKTAVVVQWAHTVRDRFPDGQLFLDLRGHDDRLAMTPAAAIVHALRSLGVPESWLPGDREEQMGLLRSHLDGRSVLIVLDNAASSDQVLPFVPASPTSALVVTSRRAMAALTTYHSVCAVQLGAMSGEESLALLRAVVGAPRIDRERSDAATVARLCAGLPLALRIVAAKLLHRPELTFGELAAELSGVDRLGVLDIEGDARGVRAVLASAYRTLSEPAAALFRRLGVQPELGFDPHLAAAVGGGDQTEALAELVGAHLIAAVGGGRYRFHDLIGVYARECVDDSRDETVTRLLDWYLGIADAANRSQPSTYDRVTPELTYPPAQLPFGGAGPAGLSRRRAAQPAAGDPFRRGRGARCRRLAAGLPAQRLLQHARAVDGPHRAVPPRPDGGAAGR
ncbi:DNA-binding SARP family transcriptional activator [Allocatelliglobosispora scoriae]|uniref:DNA-binding SARP family transcriptional activator n=1 Tax=Allocatelliglobosispora scoriae TaxID=643052 RepID=A0A841BIZ0_9ACTN|nr:BTAD domain-containing putative transcriptional regulator [Allocatelliglobosispora scoriae]MBB5866871.1 DNA-binding SARP family transcriptional activator [Allocatelliglobosispora scoriae]